MTWVSLLLPAIGVAALLIAHRRFRTADRNRLEDQFLRGAALMDPKNSAYTGRVAGAVTLADIAIKNPDEYDKRVMRVFEGSLGVSVPIWGESRKRRSGRLLKSRYCNYARGN